MININSSTSAQVPLTLTLALRIDLPASQIDEKMSSSGRPLYVGHKMTNSLILSRPLVEGLPWTINGLRHHDYLSQTRMCRLFHNSMQCKSSLRMCLVFVGVCIEGVIRNLDPKCEYLRLSQHITRIGRPCLQSSKDLQAQIGPFLCMYASN